MPDVKTWILCAVAPLFHRLLPGEELNKVTLLPWQKVMAPEAIMVGIAGLGATVTETGALKGVKQEPDCTLTV